MPARISRVLDTTTGTDYLVRAHTQAQAIRHVVADSAPAACKPEIFEATYEAVEAGDREAGPEPTVVRPLGHGGMTGLNDYLMSDGSVRAMRPDEAVALLPKRPGGDDPTRAVKLGHDLPSLDRLDAAIDDAMRKEPDDAR